MYSVKCIALCVGGRRILHPDAVTTTPVTQPFSNLTGDQHKVFAKANKEVRRGDLNKTWSGPSWISPTKAPNQGREQAAGQGWPSEWRCHWKIGHSTDWPAEWHAGCRKLTCWFVFQRFRFQTGDKVRNIPNNILTHMGGEAQPLWF